MLKKQVLTLLILLYTLFSIAENKLSLHTHFLVNHHKELLQSAQTKSIKHLSVNQEPNGTTIAQIIINKDDATSISSDILKKLNININCDLGTILTATIPVENITELAKLNEVKSISIARRVHLLNDSARADIGVDKIHTGYNLNDVYKGKNVVVGIIDTGIDYNHINFKDSNGNTRIKKAGKYNPRTKKVELYTTPSSIASLTTDNSAESHGTHVAGIATGSYTNNNYHGMAPESDIILYGLENELTNVNIINGIKTIFDYADSVNKPAVINISLGINAGAHDKTDEFNRTIEKLTGEGRIVVFAVGNEGEYNLHINSVFNNQDTSKPQLGTIVEYNGTTYYSEIDAWSRNNEPFGLQFFIYDRSKQTEILTSQIFLPTSTNFEEFKWNNIILSQYFKGTIVAYGQLDPNNKRYQLYTYIDGNVTKSNYRIGIKYYGKPNTEIDCWASPSPNQLVNLGNPNYTQGTPNNSYNSMACADNAIAIGAYSTRRGFYSINNQYYYYTGAINGDIATFSSYGTDIYGRIYPDVVAPGYTVISSVNNYDQSTTVSGKSYLASQVSKFGDDRKYHWGDMAGTSMAAPVATGTIALWLQANPDLTPTEIRTIMKETATTDKFTHSSNSIQWGAGKLNAYDGLVKILQDKSDNSAITNIYDTNNSILLYPNPSNGNFTLFAQHEECIKVDIYTLNGTIVFNDVINTDNGLVNMQLNNKLTKGLYIIKVEGTNTSFTTKLIIK